MTSLADALPEEIIRVRRLRDEYAEAMRMIGDRAHPIMQFQIDQMDELIDRATRVSCSGDVLEMLRVHGELKEWES